MFQIRNSFTSVASGVNAKPRWPAVWETGHGLGRQFWERLTKMSQAGDVHLELINLITLPEAP